MVCRGCAEAADANAKDDDAPLVAHDCDYPASCTCEHKRPR